MQEQFCDKGCCLCRFCPLELAWATTVYRFQGFEAGFADDDWIKYIVANIGELAWEQSKPGTAYMVTSRAKTIGKVTKDNPYPKDSNLFFDGQISRDRFLNGMYCQDGSLTKAAAKREAWVIHLMSMAAETNRQSTNSDPQTTAALVERAMSENLIRDTTHLEERIVEMLKNPNTTWRTRRKNYTVE